MQEGHAPACNHQKERKSVSAHGTDRFFRAVGFLQNLANGESVETFPLLAILFDKHLL